MSDHYERSIRFADIDAAGFVYFAHYLSFCHEAYEAGLQRAGIELRAYFIANRLLLPIAKAQVQFLGGLQSGDTVRVEFVRSRLSESMFRLDYRMIQLAAAGRPEKLVGLAQTEHVCMDLQTLQRKPLPEGMLKWLSSTG